MGREIEALSAKSNVRIEAEETPALFGSRRLGYIVDMFVSPKNVALLHGTANAIPLLGKYKKILTIHDLFQAYPPEASRSLYKILRSWFYKVQFGLMIREADRLIVVSEKTKHAVLKKYNFKRGIEVIYPGLNSNYLTCALPHKRKETRVFIAFASLDSRKNTTRILEAFSQFNSMQAQKFSLVLVVSSKKALARFKIEASTLGILQELTFRMNVSTEEMPAFYQSSSALVFPSLAEGFGYPIYEALSQGTPVLTSENSLLPGLAGLQGRAVIECDSFSIAAIVEGLVRLSKLDLAVEERRSIASEVRQTLDPVLSAQKVWNLYMEVLSDNK